MPDHKNKIIKILTISGIVIFLIISGVVLFQFGVQSYLKKNLSQLVHKKTKGYYELYYDNLHINLKKWGVEIDQASFHPSDSVFNAIKTSASANPYYLFSSPKIQINGVRVIQLLFNRKLELHEILIDHPEIHIHGGQQTENENKNDQVDSLLKSLKPLVTRFLKSIKIDRIELQNASYDFYNLVGNTKKLSNAENITFGILDFYTDSLLLPNPDKLFNASDIYIRMQKYQSRLADSIHVVNARSVTYSLKRSVVEAQDIELKPIVKTISNKSLYHFLIQSARITTNQLKNLLNKNIIPIDSLILANALIEYWPAYKKDAEIADEFNLNDLIHSSFTGLAVKNLVIKNTQLKLYRSQNDTTCQQRLKKFELRLSDFRLDSIAQIDTSRVFYARGIDLSAVDYHIVLGDNRHHVTIGELNLSTQKGKVLVEKIKVFPTNDQNNKNNIEAACDTVLLDCFNFKKAYHQKRFYFQKISLINPEVKFVQNTSVAVKDKHEQVSFVYDLISRYAKGVYANQVSVKKGKLQLLNPTGVIRTGDIESSVRLQLSGFALDENSIKRTDRLFYANQIELNFSNYQMQLVDQLHKLTIDNLSISTRKKSAKLENLHLFPVSKENVEELLKKYNRSEMYEFSIPLLSLTNTDFHNAFFNKKLSVDTLKIDNPQIYYENFASLKQDKPRRDFDDLFYMISGYLVDIQIKTVDIPEGTIRLISHNKRDQTISFNNNFSLTLGNMLINANQFGQKKLLFSDYVDFSVRNYLIHLSDNVHVLKAGEVGFSTRKKEIYVSNARMYPETNSKDFSLFGWNIQISVPEIRIKGINVEDMFFNNSLTADNLIITSPDIKLYKKQEKQKKNIKEMQIPLPKEIESIVLNNFQVKDGSLKIFSELGTKPYLLVQSDIKMNAHNILIQKALDTGLPEFKKGDYTANLVQFKFTPKDKNQQYSFDELNFSTSEHTIQAQNLVVKPVRKSSKQNQFELQIPSLLMTGFDTNKAYKNDLYNFTMIDIYYPVFQRYINEKDSVKVNPFNVNLYPYFESFADGFYSGALRINHAEIIVFQSGQKKFDEFISFNLNNVKIENKASQGFLHSADFSFKIPETKKQGNFYRFETGEMSYSSLNNRFMVKNIHIHPIFSKDIFQKKKGVQFDYYSGKIDSVYIINPDIKRWFEKEEISGRCISVNGMNLDIYRDKTTPFDESRRSLMLQDLIKSMKQQVDIDSLVLINSNISYTEKAALDNSEGTIRFSHIHARLFPFTNIKGPNKTFPDFDIKGTASIQDSCHLKVTMNYLMNNPANLFTVKGSLNKFGMRIFNPVIEPLAHISVKTGKVNRFDFNFSADQNSSTGQLFFGYDNLKIAVLEMKDGNTKEAKFASFLANSLLLRNKNPRGKEFLPDEISFHRDQRKSVTNYWWKSIFSGVRNTLGIKENKAGNN
jgi:hypothetical protein